MSELNEKNGRPDVTEMYYFALKSAVTIVLIIEEDAEKNNDFAIQELLLDQKNKIHSQIDLLLKVKKRYHKKYCGTVNLS